MILNLLKLKNWLAYPLSRCACIFIFVCDDCVLKWKQMVLQMDLCKTS